MGSAFKGWARAPSSSSVSVSASKSSMPAFSNETLASRKTFRDRQDCGLGFGSKYNACVVLARSSREIAVESIRNSFAAHS